jgi:general secretion pathway protein D
MMNVTMRTIVGTVLGASLLFGCAASQLHRKGVADIDRGNYEDGVAELSAAVQGSPDNLSYKLDLAARRESSIQKLISTADGLRAAGQWDQAVTTYRRVLAINPTDQRAKRGIDGVEADRRHASMVAEAYKDFERKDYDAADTILRSVLDEDAGFGPATALAGKITIARGPTTVAPRLKSRNNAKVTLQFRDAPTKMVFEVLARQTGINFVLDKDVKSDSKTTIFVQDVPIEDAIDLVLDQNTLARQILSSNMVLIYPNTTAKQKDYEEQIVHTFYLTNAVPKDVEGLLKSMLGAKTLFVDERTNVVVMRDTPDAVRMAEKLVASIDVPEPEVLISVEVLEIARSKLLNLGITPPSSATVTASSTGAAAAAASGGSSLVVADLLHQNSRTLGITPLSISANALQTLGNTNTLASPRIRARNKEKAKILIGSRVPVITSSTALLTSGTASSSSVQYLDVGLTLEVQPTVYQDGDVAIKIGLEVSSITNTVVVGGTQAYTIGTRNANTLLRLKDGETQILAGLIQDSDTRNSAGIPGLSQIPIVGRLFGSNNTDREKSEIVLSITPHIIRTQARPESDNTEFWYGTETRSRSSPFGSASFDSGSAGASAGPGGASGGTAAAAASGPGIPTVGPRPSVSQPVVVTPPTAAPPAPPPAPAGPPPHPTVTVDGPGEIAVGQEFDVTVHMATDIGISKLRGQVRFDSSALQLVSGTPGEIVPSSAGSPTVDAKGGGAQLDVVASDDPIQGDGNLMVLHFKALAARPASSITAQVSAMGPSGGAMANAASQPLSVAIKP